MDIVEIRKKTDEELNKLLFTKKEELRVMRFQIANLQFKGVREYRELRKLIAQISTVLQERKQATLMSNQVDTSPTT